MNIIQEKEISAEISRHNKYNLSAIEDAVKTGRINAEAGLYLKDLYTDGMHWFRQVFYVLGMSFGAPKAAVMQYDTKTGSVVDQLIRISDINPLSAYLVNHRLDADPMRNQFFTMDENNRVNLSVSSIVSVIVGAQKKIERTLDKISGKYYNDYTNNVIDVISDILARHSQEEFAPSLIEKVRDRFKSEFITNASEVVLGIIGGGHEKMAVDLVRKLDKITKPHLRLRDVWRVKCLFDLIPQARTFIERIRAIDPDKIIEIRDGFYKTTHPRNYRDAKIILNIGNGTVVPLEIICQVRTFFDFEKGSHSAYKGVRKQENMTISEIEKQSAKYHEEGVRKYNIMICNCLDDLFDRVGWNILYNSRPGDAMFDGFPRISNPYYPEKIIGAIMDKLENGVENEVFSIKNAPRNLSKAEESEIFQWMARFILVSAVPYMDWDWEIPGDGQAEKLFNFVMKELQRYYKK